jgi:Flp pilus assembly protein TadD
MKRAVMIFVLSVLSGSCATQASIPSQPLSAPPGTSKEIVTKLQEGNRLYQTGKWPEAKAVYASIITSQPSLAEAHYNLALALDRLGDGDAARVHYMEAANLAPGNKVIWDAPPLRRYNSDPTKGNSFLDPSPR